MKKDEKIFINYLGLILIILLFFFCVILYLIINKYYIFGKIVLFSILILSLVLFSIAFYIFFVCYKIFIKKKKINENNSFLGKILPLSYPFIGLMSRIFNIDINIIRRVYIKLNNLYVLAKDIRVNTEQILILLPHCLQNSKCKHKITNDIGNCKMCGKCDISSILKLSNKKNIRVVVATGGTLARKWVKEFKPKAIIAIACERDLASGIYDMKSIPVLGVFNQRPEGPCFNTRVIIKKIEEAINYFTKEG